MTIDSGPICIYHDLMSHAKVTSGVAIMALFLGVLVPLATSASDAAAGVPDTVSWLAAGDSYASGAGLPHTNSPCAQGTGKNGLSSTWAVVAAKKLTAEGWSIEGGGPTLVACTELSPMSSLPTTLGWWVVLILNSGTPRWGASIW